MRSCSARPLCSCLDRRAVRPTRQWGPCADRDPSAAQTHRLLYDRAVRVQPDDLTARARIREAALELFAEDGVAGTSLRSVAAKAAVSPSLVVHHFGTKAGLREAVDDAVLTAFSSAMVAVDMTGGAVDVSARLND